jgi:hypothetical protein
MLRQYHETMLPPDVVGLGDGAHEAEQDAVGIDRHVAQRRGIELGEVVVLSERRPYGRLRALDEHTVAQRPAFYAPPRARSDHAESQSRFRHRRKQAPKNRLNDPFWRRRSILQVP